MLYDPVRKKESSPTFQVERETCLTYFSQWNEADQVDFVEQLLSRMCHYQHGHIDAFLKPMLQRDFISLLPSKSPFNPNNCRLGHPTLQFALCSSNPSNFYS